MKTKNLLNKKITQWLLLGAMLLGCSANAWATDYYYRGGDNGWGATKMTASSDGYYCYIQSSNSDNQFKIATSTGGWDYNYSKVEKNFNGTDVGNIGDYGQDNCYCWQSGTYYIILYYPNTDINTDNDPKICAATYLPDNQDKWYIRGFDGCSWDPGCPFEGDDDVITYTKEVTSTGDKEFKLYYDKWYGDTNAGTITRDNCTDWQMVDAGEKGNTKINVDVPGTYIIQLTQSTKKLSVIYPEIKYFIKHSWNEGDWTWKEMSDNEDGTWSLEDYYGGTGCNWNTKADDNGSTWVASPTLVGTPSAGDKCTFTLNVSEKTITITKIKTCEDPDASNFEMSDDTQTYTGSELHPTITTDGGMGTMTVKYDGTAGTGKTNAGTYAITVDVAAGTTYCAATGISLGNFVINQKTPAASDFSLSNNTKTYTGSAQKPTFSNAGDGTISKYYYSNNGGSSWTEYANGPTNAGTYKVKVDVAAGTNYSAKTGIVLTDEFTITCPNVATPTFTGYSAAVCQGTQVSLTASVSSGAVGTCTYTWGNPDDWTSVSKSGNQFSANANSAGSVTLTVTNGCGNTSAQGTQAVSVKDIPSITSIAAGTGNNECGTGNVTFNSTGATSEATIQWYENSTKLSEGTATSYTLKITDGSSRTLKAKAVKDGCESGFTEEATGSRKANPVVSKDLASPTAYEVITLSTNLGTEVTWSKTDANAYFVKDQQAVGGNEVTAETIVLKAPAGNYSITTKKSGECDGNINITVGTATETCN